MASKYARKPYKKRVYKKRKATKSTKAIKALIKKEVHIMAEDKKALPISSQVAISTPAAVGALPQTMQYTIIGNNGIDSQIVQGVGEGGRVGNKITPRRLYLQGFINPLSTLTAGTTYNAIPMIARLVIYRAKDNLYPMNYTVGTTTFNPWSQVFQNGNTTLAPNNSYYDMMYLINKDKYIVYKEKRFKVGTANPYQNNGVSSTPIINSNNDFKLNSNYKINLSKKLKKLIYNDVDLVNTSHAMHCTIFFCTYDNSALAPNTNYLQTFYNIEMDYEDL